MKSEYCVRELQQGDSDRIFNLAMESWKYTYKNIFSEDFIESYVNRAYRKESLENIFSFAKQGLTKFFVLLERKSETVSGFAQIGYDRFWESGEKTLPLRLFRIYLNPQILGGGLGTLLLKKVEEFVRQEQQISYIVGVHERNTIGLRFYEKMGFKTTTIESDAEGEIYFEKMID